MKLYMHHSTKRYAPPDCTLLRPDVYQLCISIPCLNNLQVSHVECRDLCSYMLTQFMLTNSFELPSNLVSLPSMFCCTLFTTLIWSIPTIPLGLMAVASAPLFALDIFKASQGTLPDSLFSIFHLSSLTR